MTIKEFAQLCACNTQTLRYYDRIGLLRPRQVDPWSRYRYYEAAQALDFVRIKNLQLADFTIEEIKALLEKNDEEIYNAFNQKIAQQQEKLDRIKKIQQSYLREKDIMEQLLQGITDFLLNQVTDFEGLKEFGLQPQDGEKIVALVRAHFRNTAPESYLSPEEVSLTVGEQTVQGADQVLEKIHELDASMLDRDIILNLSKEKEAAPAEFETIWECHDWQHIYEFIDQIPALDHHQGYQLSISLCAEKSKVTSLPLSFPLFMMGALLLRNENCGGLKGCLITDSTDGKNHFALQRKKP